jgi:hypothetical protein
VARDEPKQIALERSILRTGEDHVRSASPTAADNRGGGQDRERYSIDDEFKMVRIGPSAETEAYNDHVEAARTWGRTEKEKLGLTVPAVTEAWLTLAKNPTAVDSAEVVSKAT